MQLAPVALSQTGNSWTSPTAARCEASACASRRHDARRVQCSAKRRDCRDVLDEGTPGPVKADRRAGIDAFKRCWLLADIEHLLIAEYGLDVASVSDASQEPPPAAVHRNRNLGITTGSGQTRQSQAAGIAHRPQCFNRLSQARN